ncbi:MAG: hypothetical protein AAB865_00080 [Patescibacteria group bacterium]
MSKLLLKLLEPFAALLFWAIRDHLKRHRRLPTWYFFAFERLAPMPAWELLVTKKTERGLELLLDRRLPNDHVWPGEWSFPGTILSYHDVEATAFKRLATELGIDELPTQPRLVTVTIEPNERGRHAHIFWQMKVAPETEFPNGTFFPVNTLPEDTIRYQARQIHELSKLLS